MALYLSFTSGVCFLSGMMLLLKEGLKAKGSDRNALLVFTGIALMVWANDFWLFAEKDLSELAISANATRTQISQFKTTDKPNINGHPIYCNDLPNGTYNRLEDERFAFVYLESENPFEQNIIAVYSDGRIPWRFVIVKIPEDAQKEIEKMKKKPIKIKNPLVVANP